MISFRQAGQVIEAPLKTDYGPLRLSLGQICASAPTDGVGHRLYTLKYAYYIYLAEAEKRPILRWEYTRKWPTGDSRWCRHHLQGPINLPMGEPPTSLDALHLPTGYVCVEDIIRFCICDLGAPSKSENWHDLLEESYRSFTTDFTRPGTGRPDPQN